MVEKRKKASAMEIKPRKITKAIVSTKKDNAAPANQDKDIDHPDDEWFEIWFDIKSKKTTELKETTFNSDLKVPVFTIDEKIEHREDSISSNSNAAIDFTNFFFMNFIRAIKTLKRIDFF
jgi:hypothetical protein